MEWYKAQVYQVGFIISEDYNELFELWDKSAAENAEEFEQLDKELDEADID